MTLASPVFDQTAPLPITDPATCLRRSGIRHPDGRPPIVDGCRWCGVAYFGHGQGRWVASRGWHQWEVPTEAQRAARRTARQPVEAPAAVTAGARRRVCDEMNHDGRGRETFCQEDPDDGHPVHDDGDGTTWDRED